MIVYKIEFGINWLIRKELLKILSLVDAFFIQGNLSLIFPLFCFFFWCWVLHFSFCLMQLRGLHSSWNLFLANGHLHFHSVVGYYFLWHFQVSLQLQLLFLFLGVLLVSGKKMLIVLKNKLLKMIVFFLKKKNCKWRGCMEILKWEAWT